MSRNTKHILFAIAWLFSIAAAYFVGGFHGFTQGTTTELALCGPDAAHSVGVLTLLRAGKTDVAINLLELNLDSQLVSCIQIQHFYYSPFNLPIRFVFRDRPVQINAWSLGRVLKYREQYPPVAADSELRQELMQGLEAYRDAPKPNLGN